jgi:hypothetical protein
VRKVRKTAKMQDGESPIRYVVDDLAHDLPVTAAELDAVEAFLVPLVNALLSDQTGISPVKTTADAATTAVPAHKRLNALLLEECRARTS